jgi:hypothetical protein
MKEGEEVAMRMRKAFLSMAVLAAGGLLAATGAMAQDPAPPLTCTTTNGWAIQTPGPIVGPCSTDSTKTCTQVLYDITAAPGSTPDHVATFVRGEVSITSILPVSTISSPCDGDSVIGMPSNVDCHETLIRWNNQATKAFQFGVEGLGARNPIATSVVVKKGNSVGSCPIAGLGLEGTSPLATVTPLAHEVLGGKCKVVVKRNPHTGQFEVSPDGSLGPESGCTHVDGPYPVGSVDVQVHTDAGTDTGSVEFSEGFNFIVGNGSCTYKQYYPTTGPVYRICY